MPATVLLTKVSVPVGSVIVMTTDPSASVTRDLLAIVVSTEITVPAASVTVVTTDPSAWVTTLLVLLNDDGCVGAALVDDALDISCADTGWTILIEAGSIGPMLSLINVLLSIYVRKRDVLLNKNSVVSEHFRHFFNPMHKLIPIIFS